MDNNNNQPDQPNENQFLGRGVPLEERVGERFQCRKCRNVVAHIVRHEAKCQGKILEFWCARCETSFPSDQRAERHHRIYHPQVVLPADFLNPHFNHRRERRRAQAVAAPPAPIVAAPPAPVSLFLITIDIKY